MKSEFFFFTAMHLLNGIRLNECTMGLTITINHDVHFFSLSPLHLPSREKKRDPHRTIKEENMEREATPE